MTSSPAGMFDRVAIALAPAAVAAEKRSSAGLQARLTAAVINSSKEQKVAPATSGAAAAAEIAIPRSVPSLKIREHSGPHPRTNIFSSRAALPASFSRSLFLTRSLSGR